MSTSSFSKAAPGTCILSFARATTPWDERKEGRLLLFTAKTWKQSDGRASQLHPLPSGCGVSMGVWGGHVATTWSLGNGMCLLVSQVLGGQATLTPPVRGWVGHAVLHGSGVQECLLGSSHRIQVESALCFIRVFLRGPFCRGVTCYGRLRNCVTDEYKRSEG